MWLKELKTYSNPDAKVFLIGNKADLTDKRKVTFEEGEKLKEAYQLNFFMECSAKTGFNSQGMFIEAAKALYNEYNQYNTTRKSMSSYGTLSTKQRISALKIGKEIVTNSEKSSSKKKGCC